jgi:hypothetical protein
MDGLGLENIVNVEQVEAFFNDGTTEEPKTDEGSKDEKEDTAEVDFSDLIGEEKPEGVGSESDKGNDGSTPKSNNTGTPLFSSIAKVFKDEGVFPDISDDAIKEVKDAASFRKMIDDEISKSLDDRQKRIEKALNSGASNEEVQQYQSALNISQYLNSNDTYNTLLEENEEGENLRKNILYQDYVNRGFKPDKAEKLVLKSIEDGTDIEDAKDAFDSCKNFYNSMIENYQNKLKEKEDNNKKEEEKKFDSIKKHLLDTESFYDGVKVSKEIRQRAYEAITKPVYKGKDGRYMNTLQQYQKEHPTEYMENVALLYALTNGFKSVENLTKPQVNAKLKKGFAELENVLNTTRRNGDGSLNLANTTPDELDRENWVF